MNKNEKPSLPQAAQVSEAITDKMGRWSFYWLLPLIAVAIAVMLVMQRVPAKGAEIQIELADGSGITANSTLIRYQGIPIGIVKAVRLAPDLERVLVTAELDKAAAPLARAGTQFWVVRPEFSIQGVEGLDTIVSGPYISLKPGEGERQTSFIALTSLPVGTPQEPGLKLVLLSKRAGSLKNGTPLLYRDVRIGQVYQYQLQDNSQGVELFVHVEEVYRNLVRENSVFWNSSGFDLNVSLFGAKITTESLKGILMGGISLATPDQPGATVIDGARFTLEEEQEKKWLDWQPSIEIQSEVIKAPAQPEATPAQIIEQAAGVEEQGEAE